ncbi:Cytochrome P450 CYP4, partial [Frankliniella occidentalis]
VFPASDGISDPSQFKTTFDLVLRYIGGVKVRFEPRN